MESEYIYLNRVRKELENGGLYPYDLYLIRDNRSDFICIGEGSGFGSVGGSLTPDEFVSGKWDKYIEIFNAVWLKDLILEIGPKKIGYDDVVNYWRENVKN